MSQTQLLLDPSGASVSPSLQGVVVSGSQVSTSFDGQNYARMEVDGSLTALTLKVQYSINDGEDWTDLCNTASLSIDSSAKSRWFNIPQEAKTELLARAVAVGLIGATVRFIEVESR